MAATQTQPQPPQGPAGRRPALIVGAILAVAVAGLAIAYFGGLLGQPAIRIGGPFALTDHTGKRITEADYKDKVKLVFFGFASCPDICPSALDRISTAFDKLGPKADGAVALFVSFDSERDSPKVLADYLSNFHNNIVGLTGTAAEIDNAARAYRVYFKKIDDSNSTAGYAYDHTALVYLMARDGSYVGHFVPTNSPDEMVAKIAPLLD